MAAEERRRAGEIVAERMRELRLSAPQLAEKAKVHPSTVRALIKGTRWPYESTRARISAALGWAPEEVTLRAWGARSVLEGMTTEALVRELCRRFVQEHPHSA